MKRRRRLADRLAVTAGKFFPHRLDHFEPTRNLFQRLGDVFAQLGKPRSAAACTGDWGIDHHALALDILRRRLSDRPFARERTYARGLGAACAATSSSVAAITGSSSCNSIWSIRSAVRPNRRPRSSRFRLFDRQLQTGNQGLTVRQHGLRIGGLRHRNVPLGDDRIALGNNDITFSL